VELELRNGAGSARSGSESLAKKADFLSDIEQIDPVKHDSFSSSSEKNNKA
jgi:hypothetical protein